MDLWERGLYSICMTTRHLPLLGGHPRELGGTLRTDAWWVGPTITVLVFSSFIAYSTLIL